MYYLNEILDMLEIHPNIDFSTALIIIIINIINYR
jgi:hypothetical protein